MKNTYVVLFRENKLIIKSKIDTKEELLQNAYSMLSMKKLL